MAQAEGPASPSHANSPPTALRRLSLAPPDFGNMSSLLSAPPLSSVSFCSRPCVAQEQGFTPARVRLVRSGGDVSQPLTIGYEVGGSALPGREYATLSGVTRFAPGCHECEIVVEPRANYRNTRRDETVVLRVSPGSHYTVGGDATCVVIIRQDPSPKPLPPDSHFFCTLDLAAPALASVHEAVRQNDYRKARTCLAAHFRARTAPIFPWQRIEVDLPRIEAALRREFVELGQWHRFENRIDWSADDIANPNWGWEFNRHAWWMSYTQAYLDDPERNARFARALFAELADWIATSPVSLIYHSLHPGDRWRHLEVGIRLLHWTRIILQLKHSPLLDDDLLVDWLKSIYVHARHLEVNAELFTNRGATEAQGLFVAGLGFPEFADAGVWRAAAIERIEGMLRHDITPDGVENEFSPAYHSIIVRDLVGMRELAHANGVSLSPVIEGTLLKLFDFLLHLAEPDRRLPLLNDSYSFTNDEFMAIAAKLYPQRPEFKWLATHGADGVPPMATSRLFPSAGHVVMRSGWEREACYLLMDAGPFGTSHGHEDCLSLSVNGYGIRHLIDCGPYDYVDAHPCRIYSKSSYGKTIPLVDDLSQNRQGALGQKRNVDVRVGEPPIRPPYVWDHATPVVWRTHPRCDYACGVYGLLEGETWGPQLDRSVVVRRHVFFLKPATWIVIDDFRPVDERPHIYSGLFQCNADEVGVDPVANRVTIQLQPGDFDPATRAVVTAVQPSLTVTPLTFPGLVLTAVKGREVPTLSGWQFEKSTSWKKHPIPTVRYDLPATAGEVRIAYVLAAAPAGVTPRTPRIERVDTAPGTYGLRVVEDGHASGCAVAIALNGRHLHWEGREYDVPGLVVDSEGPQPWPEDTAR